MTASIYAKVTDRIVEALESGTIPWVKPWSTIPNEGKPINIKSKKPYSGGNVVQLWLTTSLMGYESNVWLTFKQAKELGGSVRKGEHGTPIMYARMVEKKKPEGDPDKYFLAKGYTVFNLEQCDGVEYEEPEREHYDWELNTQVEELTDGVDLRHGGGSAYFSLTKDYVQMPDHDRFPTSSDYYATLLHELTHWTGHKDRLNRDMRGTFGGADYAREELVAELGSAFLCAKLGIDGQLQHESYINSWIQVLKSDERALFTAARSAEIAAEYLQNKPQQEAAA